MSEQESGTPAGPKKSLDEAMDVPMRSVKEDAMLDGGSNDPPKKESNENYVSDLNERKQGGEAEREATISSPPLTGGIDVSTLEGRSSAQEVKQEEQVDVVIEKKPLIDPVAAAKERYLARKKQKTSGS